MKKRMIMMSSALILVFGGLIGFNFFKSVMIKRFFASYSPPPASVSAVKAVQKNWQPHIAAVGNFVATNGVDINAEAAGNITKIHFESGQYIEAGSSLIDLEDQADQASLKFNRAELALRQLNYKRQADLFKRGATSRAAIDEAKANLEQSQANVERTEAEIKKKHITSPFAGQLGIRQVNLGQYITPGQTTIVTLQSLDPLYLEFYIPEHLLHNLKVNQAIKFSLEEYPHQLFEGKITALNAKVDPNTHNILVQASLPNCPAENIESLTISPLIERIEGSDGEKTIIRCNSTLNKTQNITQFAFIPGMFASIEIEQPPIPNVIVLPSTAISYSLYGNSVFIIEKDGKKDKDGKEILRVKRSFVTTGEQQGNYTIIKKGIKAGQAVVSSGELKLQNDSRVIINNSITLNEKANPQALSQ